MDAEMQRLEIELRHLRRQIATYQWEFKATEDVDMRTEILRKTNECVDAYGKKVHRLAYLTRSKFDDALE